MKCKLGQQLRNLASNRSWGSSSSECRCSRLSVVHQLHLLHFLLEVGNGHPVVLVLSGDNGLRDCFRRLIEDRDCFRRLIEDSLVGHGVKIPSGDCRGHVGSGKFGISQVAFACSSTLPTPCLLQLDFGAARVSEQRCA